MLSRSSYFYINISCIWYYVTCLPKLCQFEISRGMMLSIVLTFRCIRYNYANVA